MSSQLTRPSTLSVRPVAASSRRRSGTLDLETQSAFSFGLAVAVGIAAIVTATPLAGTVALVVVSVALASRALAVLSADPRASRSLRPREMANWDGAIAAALGLIALVLVADGATGGAIVALVGAITMGALRLRTRYVTAS